MKRNIIDLNILASKAIHFEKWFAGLLLVGLLLIASSCDKFFEKAPGVDVTKDTIFSTAARATYYLCSLYNKLPDGYFYNWTDAETQRISGTMLASCSEQAESGWSSAGSQLYNTGSISQFTDESVMDPKWKIRWPIIYRARWFLDNIDNIKTATDDQRSMMRGEARFIIALHYFEFMIKYGGVPWLSHKLDFSTDDYKNLPRMPLAQMVDSIDKLCVDALNEPGLPASRIDAEFGRATKAAVLTLRARLWLFAARPLFNADKPYMNMDDPANNDLIYMGNYDAGRWQKAADCAKAAIDYCEANGYALHYSTTGDPSLSYQEATRDVNNNKELIFVSANRSWSIKSLYPCYESPNVVAMGVADGCTVCPTQNIVDRYLMKNGKPQNDPTSNFDPSNPYANLDPRFYATIAQNLSKWGSRTVELWNNRTGGNAVGVDFGFHRRDLSVSKTGYLLRKFCLESVSATTNGNNYAIWPYMRLADLYLMYAEALNEAQGPKPDCFTYLDKVRARAGMPDVDNTITSKDSLREVILREREIELAMEDIHYYDVKSLKRGNILGEPVYGIDIRRVGSSAPYTYTYTKEKLEDRFWADYWYLWPIPNFDMIRSKALVQNPGW